MGVDIQKIKDQVLQYSDQLERVKSEVRKVLIGQDVMLSRLLIALLTGGHVLLEGVPGLAKTTAIKALAAAIHCKFNRIQFTPDLLPADLIGTLIYNPREGAFSTRKGPIFANLILADEINRAPSKVQSAPPGGDAGAPGHDRRRIVHARRAVSGPGHAEPDRAGGNLSAARSSGRPLHAQGGGRLSQHERGAQGRGCRPRWPAARGPAGAELRQQLADMKQTAASIYLDDKVKDYVLDIVSATRHPEKYKLNDLKPLIEYGASPRASINLCLAARANAFLVGRAYVTPQDVKDVALDILRHRVLLTYEAEAEETTSDDVIRKVLESVPVP